MSSTKRGSSRANNDFYPTPAWCVHRLLDRIGHSLPLHRDALWLEPCVGSGAIVHAVNEWCLTRNILEPLWQLIDIAPQTDLLGVVTGNYLEASFTERASASITNPPFSLAMEFADAMRQDAKVAIVLQRLNWLGSEKRSAFWRANMPDVYILPNRPSFTKNWRGTPVTDSCEYAWFCWGLTEGGHLSMLDETPLEQRR